MGLVENKRSSMTLISVAVFRLKEKKGGGGDMGVNARVLGGFRNIYFTQRVAKYDALLNKNHTENYNALILNRITCYYECSGFQTSTVLSSGPQATYDCFHSSIYLNRPIINQPEVT
jgi:hypothetical protein